MSVVDDLARMLLNGVQKALRRLAGKEDEEMENAPCNQHIREALESARKLIILADEGELASKDDGCALLFCVVRDCAYKIRVQAERERDSHKAQGSWTAQVS